MTFYNSKRLTSEDINNLLTIKKYAKCSDYVVNYSFYNSKRLADDDINNLLMIRRYFKYSNYIVNYSFYKAKQITKKVKLRLRK